MAPSVPTSDSKKRSHVPNDDDCDRDEVSAKKARLTAAAATATTTSTKKTNSGSLRSLGLGSRRKGRQSSDKRSEIPDSDGEQRGQEKATAKKLQATRMVHAATGSSTEKGAEDYDGVYHFQDVDSEPSVAQRPSRKKAKETASTNAQPSTATKTTTGTGLNPQPKRSRGMKFGGSSALANEDEHKGDVNTPQVSSSEDELTPAPVRSVNKITRVDTNINGDETPKKLKGILTPSKRLSKRNSKSVVFMEADATKKDEVYFADIPSKANKTTSTQQKKAQYSADKENNKPIHDENVAEEMEEEEEEEEEEDDEICAICSKPDSRPPNEILFCDSCDMAVHQKCYGVPRIPKGDWLCKECIRGSSGATPKKTAVTAEILPDIPNFEQHLGALKRVLLDRCNGRRRIQLRGQDEAYDKTFQLVEQTVLAGEGNSMLVIGARGCGKTTLVDSVLFDLSRDHKNEFHVVRLNGFIHTDDKLALKDIWRQLGKEMEVEDDLIGKTSNYADTLASLLALLSHPSEIIETQEGVTSKSVIFVIDEFDLFATHARQTLLYNLFDIAQARKAPIAVLGLTNKIDVVESLEKRVKSRFSHRYVYLSLAKSLPAYWELCKQGLLVADEDAQAEGLGVSLKGFSQFQDCWAQKIEALYEDATFKEQLEYHYYSSKSVPAFFRSCVLPLANLSRTNLSLRLDLGPGMVLTNEPPDSKLHLLESLSDLDLSLLISAARLDIVAHTDTVNFAMAYDEYTSLIGRQRVQSATAGMLALGGGVRVWGRGVAEMSWERLVSLGLLLPTGLGGRHGGLEGRMWKVDVTLEEIPVAAKLNAMLARWCREI